MTKKNVPAHPVVAALYEAHVSHTITLLTGDGLLEHLSAELDADLVNAKKLKLTQVVSKAQILATARAYAIDMPMSGGIPELVGDIARVLHAHPIHDDTKLSDIVSDSQVREIVNKAVEMHELRDKLIHAVLANPLLVELSADLISRGIKGYLAQGNAAAKGIPGASVLMGLGKSVLSKASPGLEKSLDEGLQSYVRKSTAATLRTSEETLKAKLSDDLLRRIALDLWTDVKHWPASRFRQYVSAASLEEIVVIGYEFWRGELRQTPYYGVLLEVAIDSFFDKYSDATLQFLLDEVGVTRAMIFTELSRFAPPAIAALHKAKLLDGIVRRQLLPFYQSGRIEAVLAEQGV
ncbi:MAG: hypothetical protein ABIR53_06710 [Paraperlucidibaca sp.]